MCSLQEDLILIEVFEQEGDRQHILRSTSLEVLDVCASIQLVVLNALHQLLGSGVELKLFLFFVLQGDLALARTEFELLIEVDLHLDGHGQSQLCISDLLIESLLASLATSCLFPDQVCLESRKLDGLGEEASNVVFDVRVILFHNV